MLGKAYLLMLCQTHCNKIYKLGRNIKEFIVLKRARVAAMRQYFLKEFEQFKTELQASKDDKSLLYTLETSFNWIHAASFISNWVKRCLLMNLFNTIRY
jgi:hypothetical protein